MVSVRDSVK